MSCNLLYVCLLRQTFEDTDSQMCHKNWIDRWLTNKLNTCTVSFCSPIVACWPVQCTPPASVWAGVGVSSLHPCQGWCAGTRCKNGARCEQYLARTDKYHRKLVHFCLFICICYFCCLIEPCTTSPFPPTPLPALPLPPSPLWSSWILDSEMFLCCIDFCFHFRAAQTASTLVSFRVCLCVCVWFMHFDTVHSTTPLSFLLIYQSRSLTLSVRSTINLAQVGRAYW